MDWNALTAVATAVSMIAVVFTTLYIRAELKALEKDRYLAATHELFAVWQSKEFMDAQLWLLHRLKETTWPEFVAAHRGDAGEAAFHRVGAFYDRVGTLVRLGLIRQDEILVTVGGYAIAVWQKISPLVREARRLEHSTLFADFERLLPACHECYAPGLGLQDSSPLLPGLAMPAEGAGADRMTVRELHARLERGEPITVLDVRHPAQVAGDRRRLPGALALPADEVASRYRELPSDRAVVAYCS